MASMTLMTTKAGKRFWKISVSRGYGLTPYTMRWYWPEGWSKRAAEREAGKVAAKFEAACEAGEVLNRQQRHEKEEREALEAAKLKTLSQYVNGVFMPTKEVKLSENARSNYRTYLNKHILPALGKYILKEVSPAMISRFLLDFQKKGYSHSTVIKVYNILNGVFEMAFMDESIPISPMLKVKRPVPRKDESHTEEIDKALTVQELREVLSCVEHEPLKWRVYINLAADTGARRGELCGLQWKDIDWNTQTITICRNLQYTPDAGVYVANTKNGKSRVVDVGQETLSMLRTLREKQAAACISQWVFTQDGTPEPMHPQTPTRYFTRFGKRHNIKGFHPHLLRHTSASIAITNGADVVSVSQRLGHSDTAVTLRMYAHANEESIRRAGQTVRDAIKEDEQKNKSSAQ